MADIIELFSKSKPKSNVISESPLEFRKGDWLAGNAVLCTREESRKYETHRERKGQAQATPFVSLVPNSFTLDGGYHFTVVWLFRYRDNESAMRRVYRLAGFMECATKAHSPVLRTDLVRRFFKIINDEREKLQVSWKGNVQSFLLPLFPGHHDINALLRAAAVAPSLAELIAVIEREAEAQFEILSEKYVVYVPESFLAA